MSKDITASAWKIGWNDYISNSEVIFGWLSLLLKLMLNRSAVYSEGHHPANKSSQVRPTLLANGHQSVFFCCMGNEGGGGGGGGEVIGGTEHAQSL